MFTIVLVLMALLKLIQLKLVSDSLKNRVEQWINSREGIKWKQHFTEEVRKLNLHSKQEKKHAVK